MTNVKMKAVDQLFVSSVSPDTMAPGQEFEVSTSVADDLEARGLAKRVGGSKKEEAKAETAAPENKMEPEPANKGIIGASAFDPDGDGRVGGAPKGGNRKRKGK